MASIINLIHYVKNNSVAASIPIFLIFLISQTEYLSIISLRVLLCLKPKVIGKHLVTIKK